MNSPRFPQGGPDEVVAQFLKVMEQGADQPMGPQQRAARMRETATKVAQELRKLAEALEREAA